MKTLLRFRSPARAEDGMTTSEYAVGTLGACSVGGLLVKVAGSKWFGNLMRDIFEKVPSILPF